jgi:hypothetical protein
MHTIYENNLTKLSDLAFHLDGVQSLEFLTLPIEHRCHDHVAREKTYNGSIVDSWMAQCSDSHRACQPSSTWHPRRLLDVGTLKKPELKLRIMSQYQWGEGSRYFTLSHRWPQAPISCVTLKESNVEEFQEGIDQNVLHATFRDAIDITRRSHCQYIWIDSLCIIQDASEDITQDILSMDQVYVNAALNISATNAKTGVEPLIMERCAQHDVDPIYLTKNGVTVSFSKSFSLDLGPEIGPLSTRGWVLQESILATRNLHLTSFGMRWQCQGYAGVQDRTNPHLSRASNIRMGMKKSENGWRDWGEIVTDFTGRSLTERNDILAAINGVASFMGTKLGTDYLTGHWRHSLHYDLLWERNLTSGRPYKYNPELDIPTWSWACVEGQVKYPGIQPAYFDERSGQTYTLETNDPAHAGPLLPCSMIHLENVELGTVGKLPQMAKVLLLRCLLVPIEFGGYNIGDDGELTCTRFTFRRCVYGKLPKGNLTMNLDCGLERKDMSAEERKELHTKLKLYFIPTTYNSCQVAGIVVTSKLPFNDFGEVPDGIPYRRVGTLKIVKYADRPINDLMALLSAEVRVPPTIIDWVKWLRRNAVYAISTNQDGLRMKDGLIKLI